MTTDAKIGLLLGLVFIFLIAFVINGLPSFRYDQNNNELTTHMFDSQNRSLGLADNQRKTQQLLNHTESSQKQASPKPQSHTPKTQNLRFTAQLPNSSPKTQEPIQASVIPSPQLLQPGKSAPPKIYVVQPGDSLALIAQKSYGPSEGNKQANIDMIFESNRKLLKSPDEIFIGQRLVIPPLLNKTTDQSRLKNVFATTMFKKVNSIGKRYLSGKSQKQNQVNIYIVQDGDSLWRIAAEQLGDGNRYHEIAKLNADILDDTDSLVIGMNLKIPNR